MTIGAGVEVCVDNRWKRGTCTMKFVGEVPQTVSESSLLFDLNRARKGTVFAVHTNDGLAFADARNVLPRAT